MAGLLIGSNSKISSKHSKNKLDVTSDSCNNELTNPNKLSQELKMTYATKNAEILALFTATGKEIPHEDSDMGQAVQILQTICDAQNHTVPNPEEYTNDPEGAAEDIESDASDIFEALEELESNYGTDDFTLDFDGNEYRLIKESDIWGIYRDAIQETVEECYELNLDKIPSFIAISVDWEQTAKNAYADGYGHQFSSYDGSEEEAAGYHIFRTN